MSAALLALVIAAGLPATAPGATVPLIRSLGFGDEQYPAEASRRREEGVAVLRLFVDAAGRPLRCTLVSPTGSASLDQVSCPLVLLRARFTPARQAHGTPVPGSSAFHSPGACPIARHGRMQSPPSRRMWSSP